MRQYLNARKVAKLRKETGLPVRAALARGNTDHSLILVLEDGSMWLRSKDGQLEEWKA